MAGLTQETAQTMLDLWVAAEVKVAQGQEYTIGQRTLKRADLAEIREAIKFWNGEVNRLANGSGARVRGLTLG